MLELRIAGRDFGQPVLGEVFATIARGDRICLLGPSGVGKMQRITLASTSSVSVHIPQTGLALMRFSRYCPSSLDLLNSVVQECRPETA